VGTGFLKNDNARAKSYSGLTMRRKIIPLEATLVDLALLH
jgi:hypothetical protein